MKAVTIFSTLLLILVCFTSCFNRDGTKTEIIAGYQLYHEWHQNLLLDPHNIVLIDGVFEYAHDDSIIIASKNLNLTNDYTPDSSEVKWQQRNVPDSMQYWIINTKNHLTYGPFNKQEYLTMRTKLNIPLDLKLKKHK